MLLQAIHEELVRQNQAFERYNLVVWSSGNVSIRDPQTGYVVIKPSGWSRNERSIDRHPSFAVLACGKCRLANNEQQATNARAIQLGSRSALSGHPRAPLTLYA